MVLQVKQEACGNIRDESRKKGMNGQQHGDRVNMPFELEEQAIELTSSETLSLPAFRQNHLDHRGCNQTLLKIPHYMIQSNKGSSGDKKLTNEN